MALFRPLTLCYHAVSDAWDDVLATPVAAFEEQLQTLVERGFRGATAAEVLRRTGERRLLHVTFDDAYRTVANALPTLERLGLPATVFLCSDLAESGAPLRVPELQSVRQTDELATLDWRTARELADHELIEFGSHSASHPHLPRCSDSELRREVRDSRTAMEEGLGRPCALFAYPFGEHDARVREVVRAAGYSAAFAAPGSSLRFDAFAVPRTGFWRNEPLARQVVKTRFLVRVARELRPAVGRRTSSR